MSDMNAKELFRKSVNEAGPDDPAGPVPSRPPLKLSGRMRHIPLHQPGSEMDDLPPEDIQRMVGRERGQFTPKELSQLKDIMIQMLAALADSDLDKQIGQSLMTGQQLEPGQLQHIVDEARRLKLPDSHSELLHKIFTRLRAQP